MHYTGGTISEELRAELKERLIRVYAGGVGDGGYWGDDMKLCDGCHTGGLDNSFSCDSLKCAAENDVDRCQNCHRYPCDKAHHLYQNFIYLHNAVIGTTNTPSSLLYAAFESPQTTHRTEGAILPWSFFISLLICNKLLAASSI